MIVAEPAVVCGTTKVQVNAPFVFVVPEHNVVDPFQTTP